MKKRVIKINDDLKKLRSSLDNINTAIADMISQRIDIVKEVGKIKKQKKNFYVPEREKFIFKNISEKFPELDKEIVKSLFTQIISGCRSYEKIFDVGLLNDVHSLSALIDILGTFTSNHYMENIFSLKEKYDSLDYVIINLDDNFISLVENIQDIFVINYSEKSGRKFLLLGKTENTDILSGKIGFLLEENNFAKIKDSLYNYLYKVYDISENYIYIEFNFSKQDDIEKIKNLLSVPHKYMGIYPDNNF